MLIESNKSFTNCLQHIKENRKKFYKLLWENYGDYGFVYPTFPDSIMVIYLHKWRPKLMNDNPNLGAELLLLYNIIIQFYPNLDDVGESKLYHFLKFLHKRYWPKFHEKYTQRAKDNGGWPKMGCTRALKELLARGFIYRTEAKLDNKKYHVIINIGGLVWPKDFDSHQDAIDIMQRFGIPGITGTSLPSKTF